MKVYGITCFTPYTYFLPSEGKLRSFLANLPIDIFSKILYTILCIIKTEIHTKYNFQFLPLSRRHSIDRHITFREGDGDRMITHLRLKAYGKINLGLDVLGRRADGYHEVRMIMQTVRLHDSIDIYRTREPGIRLETNLYYLPTNEQNLAYRAAKLLMDEFGVRDGVSIHLRKFIPVSAGMAGGSTDAASVLFGVNKMFGLGLSTKKLMERGVTLGADIPYCLMRGTALSEGIGEKLTALPPVPQCQVLIAKPGISVSTKVVYEALDAMELKPEEHPDIDGMIGAIREKNLQHLAGKFGNVLELVTAKKYPVIGEIEQVMRRYGAVNAMMSGSGPTVFGLFTNPRAAEDAYEALRFGEHAKLAKQVYLTGFYNVKRD